MAKNQDEQSILHQFYLCDCGNSVTYTTERVSTMDSRGTMVGLDEVYFFTCIRCGVKRLLEIPDMDTSRAKWYRARAREARLAIHRALVREWESKFDGYVPEEEEVEA